MHALLEFGLNNAVFATFLAMVIAAVGRLGVRPEIQHALWVIVLLKLIAPPLIPFDLPFEPTTGEHPRELLEGDRPEAPSPTVTRPAVGDRAFGVPAVAPPAVELPFVPALAVTANDLNGERRLARVGHTPAEYGEKSTRTSERNALLVLQLSSTWAVLWLAGTLLCLCTTAVRVWRFHRVLRLHFHDPHELQGEVDLLARRVGLRRVPRLTVLPGRITPMLWSVGGRPHLIYPAALLDRLDPDARATLLLHELSHFRRGDHRFRWLEAIATALYWWYPVVWWIRRRLHEVEEECCDGFVLSEFPHARETYANALLTAISVLPTRNAAVPSMGSGIGEFQSVKRRLVGIMQGPARRGLSYRGRCAMLAAALLLVPLMPTMAHVKLPLFADISWHHADEPIGDLPVNPDGTERLVPATAEMPISAAGAVTLFSPDGAILAVGDVGGRVQFRDLYTGEPLQQIAVGGELSSAAFAPHSRVLATGHADGSLRLWETRTGELLRSARAPGGIVSLHFSAEGRSLVGTLRSANSASSGIEIWDAGTLAALNSVAIDSPHAQAALTDNGTSLAVATSTSHGRGHRYRLALYDLKTLESQEVEFNRLREGHGDLTAFAASDHGGVLAIADAAGQVVLWDRRASLVRVLRLASPADEVALSPSGEHLAVLEANREVSLWETATGSLHSRFEGHPVSTPSSSRDDSRSAIAFSPDGSVLASLGPDHRLKLWSLDGTPQTRSIDVGTYVYSLAISPDGRTALAGGANGATLWSVDEGRLRRRLKSHGRTVATAISPDGRSALTGNDDHSLCLWDLETGEERQRFIGHSSQVRSIAFAPGGDVAASCGYDQQVIVWDVTTGREIRRFAGHRDRVNALAFSPDGRLLATGDTFSIRIWNLQSGALEVHVNASAPVGSLCFSPDGRNVLAGLNDASVRLWDVNSGRQIQRFHGHSQPLETVAYSPDGRYAVSGGQDKQLLVWSPKRSKPVFQLAAGAATIKAARFTPDGRRLVTAAADGLLQIWQLDAVPEQVTLAHYVRQWGKSVGVTDVRSLDAQVTIHADEEQVAFVRFSPDGRRLATGGSSGNVHVWDAATHEQVYFLQGGTSGLTSGVFTPDGRHFVAGSWSPENVVRVWDLESRSVRVEFSGHGAPIRGVAVAPDGQQIASASEDGTVRLWDLPGKRPGRVALEQQLPVFSVAYSHDGTRLVAGTGGLNPYRPGSVLLWNVSGDAPPQRIGGLTGLQSSVLFSPDDRKIAAKRREGAISWWDIATETAGPELRAVANCLAYSRDGALLISGHLDGTLQTWDAATGQQTAELVGHQAAVTGIALAPDGRTVASSARDGRVLIWDLP